MSQNRSLSGSYLGKYKVEHRLGRGGMAEVYKAYQANLERYVAIKVMHAFLADDGDFLQRFQREAQAMAATRHPHIAGVYDFEAEGEYYYIVMEYLPGGSLKDRIDDAAEAGQLIDLELAVQVVIQIAEALAFAHSVGMIHRDIKPANIMFNGHDSAVLTDFGIAKLLSGPSYTATGSMIGTPAYMSPEQGLGEPGDERSDIYALGVLFYHLVTGNLPHEGDTPLSVVLKHVNDAPERPSAVNPELPRSVETVVMRAMAKDPDMRYQRAGDMARELRLVAQQESLDGTYEPSMQGRRVDSSLPPSNEPSSSPIPSPEGIIPEGEFDFYNNLVTPVPPDPASGASWDNFDDSDSIEFLAPPEVDGPMSRVSTGEIHTDLIHSTSSPEDPSLSTQISAHDSLPTMPVSDFYGPSGNDTAVSKRTVDNDMTQVGVSPADSNRTQVGAFPVDPHATAVTGAAPKQEGARRGFDMSALSSALAGLSDMDDEPISTPATERLNQKQKDKQRRLRNKRLSRVMGYGLRLFFILAGIVLGYGVWQEYLSDSNGGSVSQFNAWLNEQSGGRTADDVVLEGIIAEEKPQQYLLEDVSGPAIVLILDPGLEEPVGSWNTIVQRRSSDGSWEDLARWTIPINRDDQSVWPLDEDDLQRGEMYRWVIVDKAADAPADPIAQSAPFFFNEVEVWPLEVMAVPVTEE